MTTLISPPTYLAQLSGFYRIEIGARVVKGYRYDGSVTYRVQRSALPKDFDTLGYLEQAEHIRADGERIA